MKKNHVFCLLSSNKMAFYCKSIAFFCLISFLFLEIQITGAKNFTNKNDSITSPLSCISPPKIILTLHKPWTYTTTGGWLRGWPIFLLASKFVSNTILKKMWIQGMCGDMWYQCYIAKICFFNIDLFILSTFFVLTLAFLQCYMVSQV